MIKIILTIIIYFILLPLQLSSQLILNADGPGDTYELITSKLAPNYNPIEVPDCGHINFGRHIDEIFDNELNENVFRFFIHTSEDDDRCINFDRQRNEIKSYNQSPDSLLGIEGEIVEYKWKFKLDAGFQPSQKFTHIHQLKAVGGTESSMPLITLTTRLSTPEQLELRHAESNTAVTLSQSDLAPFKGTWCEVTETVTYGESGTYDITIKKVSDNSTLFSYSDNDIRMWKTQADFIRPKWGIYRSLLYPNQLRNEEVLFANFSIKELPLVPLPVEIISFNGIALAESVLLNWQTASEQNNKGFQIQRSLDHITWDSIGFVEGKENSTVLNYYNFDDTRPDFGINNYRLKQIDNNGNFKFSDTLAIDFKYLTSEIQIYPNPTKDFIQILGTNENHLFDFFDSSGKKIMEGFTTNNQISLSTFSNGTYLLILHIKNELISRRIVKR